MFRKLIKKEDIMQKCRKICIVLFSVFYLIFSPVASVFALENNQSISNKEEADKKENKNQINSQNNSAIIGSKNEQTEKTKTRNRITTSFKRTNYY